MVLFFLFLQMLAVKFSGNFFVNLLGVWTVSRSRDNSGIPCTPYTFRVRIRVTIRVRIRIRVTVRIRVRD